MKHTTWVILFVFVVGYLMAMQAAPIRIACVGNSIIEGAGCQPCGYPKKLAPLFGTSDTILNAGKGGAGVVTSKWPYNTDRQTRLG